MKQGMKQGITSFWFVMVAVLAMLHLFSSPVLADYDSPLVRDAPANIAPGQTLKSLVVVGQDATISGTVQEVVFVYHGDVHLTSTAKTGIVVVLGGTVQQESGAVVDDGIVSLAFDQSLWNNALLGLLMMAGMWGVRLLVSVLLILIPVLGMFLLRNRMNVPLQLLEQYAVKLGVAGLIVFGVTSILSVLIGLTIVGLPVSFLLAGLVALGMIVGFPLVCYRLGEWMLQRHPGSANHWVPTLTGAVAITALCNIPLFGELLLLAVASISLGTTTTWLWQNRKKTR